MRKVIQKINIIAYTGCVGHELVITATDNFEVYAVKVTIFDGSGAVVEQGPAIRGEININLGLTN